MFGFHDTRASNLQQLRLAPLLHLRISRKDGLPEEHTCEARPVQVRLTATMSLVRSVRAAISSGLPFLPSTAEFSSAMVPGIGILPA